VQPLGVSGAYAGLIASVIACNKSKEKSKKIWKIINKFVADINMNNAK